MASRKSRSKSSDAPKPLHICIVGGGSSGWMMAAYLTRQFKIDGKAMKLTLVESAEVPPTGVGEATIHTMRGYLEGAGISETKFLESCQATFKHGIEFAGWSEAGKPFFHPFETPPLAFEQPLPLHFLAAGRKDGPMSSYDNWAGIQSRIARRGVSPRQKGQKPYHGVVPYGYHLDANAFAHFLKGEGVKRGVRHVISHVESVETEGKHIKKLHLRDGKTISADLWVDCTGFAARLISELGGEFVSSADHLLINSAVTCQVSEEHIKRRPYTVATARSAGWTFDIDLQTRGGRGYVYSGNHISEDEALKEFAEAFPGQIDESKARHFKLRIGRMEESWVGNCCAVGLSAGFLEPMESTGLYFVEHAARLFVEAVQAYDVDTAQQQADWFNESYNGLFDEVSAFIEMHYKMCDRRDTEFWRDATSADHSERLGHFMSLWESRLPAQFDFSGNGFFMQDSWQTILFGLGWRPKPSRRLGAIDKKASLKHFNELSTHVDRITLTYPKQTEYFGV